MIIAIPLAVILLLYALISWFMFQMAFSPKANLDLMPKPKDAQAMSPWDRYADDIEAGVQWFARQDCQELWLTARDGAKLRGRYLPYAGSDKAIILCHGYRSGVAERDFACALKLYYHMGFNILLIDQRAQGKSGGALITFGVLERQDVADWAALVDRTYHPKYIVLDGMSMGAATVLMALALKLPPSVVGAVADCGYTTPEAILTHVMGENFGLPAKLFMPGLRLIFRLRTGHSLHEASAPKAIAMSELPILLIHGEDDVYVPCAMGRENARASSRATLVTVPGAGHGVSFLTDREKCAKALDKFMHSVIQ